MADPPSDAALHPTLASRLRGYRTVVREQDDVHGRLIPRWAVRLFAACAVLLIPWSVFLVLSLPERTTAHSWNLAWAGFDVAMALALGATALAIARRSVWSGPLAAACGTMLLVDAWFDVTTAAPGSERIEAVLMAVFLEVPLAVLLVATARHIGLVVVQARRWLEAADVQLVAGRLVGPEGRPDPGAPASVRSAASRDDGDRAV